MGMGMGVGDELWRDVHGFEGKYQVSDHGRVRSMDRQVPMRSIHGLEYYRHKKGVELRPGTCRGYLIVNLFPYGTIAVHRLVAQAFVEGYKNDGGLEVNHKDGNKRNNHASNLEWVTKKENQDHAVAKGLRKQAVRVAHPVTGEEFPSITKAAKACHVRHRTASLWRL